MISQRKEAGFEAWVEGRDDHELLNEHQVLHHPARCDEAPYTECFLETCAEPFRIKVSRLPFTLIDSDWECYCYVDGNDLGYPVWWRKDQTIDWDYFNENDGGQMYTSSLKFAPLPTTDDPSQVTLHLNSKTLKTLGTIEITLRRGSFRPDVRKGRPTTMLEGGVVQEKEKKFLQTITTVDRKLDRNKKTDYWTFRPSGDGRVYYRFLFKYRPRVLLEKMGIIEVPEGEEENDSERFGASPRKKARTQLSVRSAGAVASSSGKRLSGPIIDLSKEGDDFTPVEARRLRYLEERVRALREDNRRMRDGEQSGVAPIDLTGDD